MPGLTMNESSSKRKKVAVCGGGLVGCLAACYFAQRDYDVTLYEYRSDIRRMKVVVGRSINMAMSVRGREGLRGIGAEEAITSKGIEMYSRMLHDTKGRTSAVPYGKKNECILSIDRRYLNELLLTEAEKSSNIRIEFNHKLMKCDTNTGELVFENMETRQVINDQADLVIGCDGAFSAVRASLLKDKPVDYSQEYISSYYLELQIPASSKGEFLMPPNHLHIWPRGQFMLIALPNQDCTFTCTLFMPLDMFDQIKTPSDLISFFEANFVDSLNLIGKDRLIETYFANKPQPLVSVRCNPHHGKKCVLLGDSAHAMVPFYGQGMNCGFEDCIVFFDLLDKYGRDNLDQVLAKYSEIRVPDAHAICDLAIRNYEEMRYLVTTRKYILRKYLDNFLNKIFPNSWIPLYSMVTFSRIRYSEVIEKRKRQDEVLEKVAYASATTLVAALVAAAFTFRSKLF